MSVILLDPAMVIPDDKFTGESVEFWDRLTGWCDDRRALLGYRLWAHLSVMHAAGELSGPPGLRQIVYRVVGDLLTREPIEHSASFVPCALSAEYGGSDDHREFLADDLVGTEQISDRMLGSFLEVWPTNTKAVSTTPEAPLVPIVFEPNTPSADERRQAAAAWFAGKAIVLVGGQVDQAVISAMARELVIPLAQIRWIPSEKNKKATNLNAVIGGLGSDDLVICITGKVGHDVSGQMAKACERKKFTLHRVQYSSRVLEYLWDLHANAASAE
jgi:hypothetical protein